MAPSDLLVSTSRPPATTPPPAPSPAADLSPAFFAAAVANAGIPVLALDLTGRIRFWNPAAARLFGRPDAEVLGHPLDLLIPLEYRHLATAALARTLDQRSVNTFEMAFIPPGGKNPLHIGVTLSCVLDENAACLGLMAWLRDISSRKELESHLTRSRHMASLGTLAAGVAHHFNNIACGMSAMVELALSTDDPAAMHRALHMSAEAASRIGTITQSLLAFSSQDDASPDLSDLTEEILSFADAVAPTLQKKGITLELDLQARRVAAVPRHRFVQSLQHLLRNSEEAFDELADPRPRKITIRTRSQDEQIMLQFSDNAAGIAPEHLPSLFVPFFTTKGVQAGGNRNNLGLGLALVHGTVVHMGGHIWADSTPHTGTTITLLIPITT